MSERYKVVDGSQSAHCCFGATVVDTTRPTIIGRKHYNDEFESICECWERSDADRIAAALNSAMERETEENHDEVG